MADIYISLDIETDGKIPGENSMLSLGAAAFTETDGLIATFTENIEQLRHGVESPDTMRWWLDHPEAWLNARKYPLSPEIVIPRFVHWVTKLSANPIGVAYPASFDAAFIDWYLHSFGARNPFKRNYIDVESYAMGLLRAEYSEMKSKMPEEWLRNIGAHPHIALDDAVQQGRFFMNMKRWATWGNEKAGH